MIACVLKSGGIYGPEHVRSLAEQTSKVAPSEPFVCLSDVLVDGIETVALRHDWPGWWSKLELFRPDVFPAGERVLFADLDTVIVGDLDSVLSVEAPFVALADFYRRPPLQRMRGLGSGLLRWTAGEQAELYDAFRADADVLMRKHAKHGDQEFIERLRPIVSFWEDEIPGQIVSFKVHCRKGIPENARIVCFHGKPKPWDLGVNWGTVH